MINFISKSYHLSKKAILPIIIKASNSKKFCSPSEMKFYFRHMIEDMFLRFCPPLLQLLKNFPDNRIKTEDKNIIRGFMNIYDCHLGIFNDSWSKGKSEQELKPVLEGIFMYSCVWAMGGLCDRFLGEKFSNLFYELMEGDVSNDLRKSLGITVKVSGVQDPYSLPIPKIGDVRLRL